MTNLRTFRFAYGAIQLNVEAICSHRDEAGVSFRDRLVDYALNVIGQRANASITKPMKDRGASPAEINAASLEIARKRFAALEAGVWESAGGSTMSDEEKLARSLCRDEVHTALRAEYGEKFADLLEKASVRDLINSTYTDGEDDYLARAAEIIAAKAKAATRINVSGLKLAKAAA